MERTETPSVRSRRLGAELRRLREAAGLTMGDAAAELQCGQPKISKIEAGRRGVRPLDLDHLLTLYGLHDTVRRQALKRLAAHTRRIDWWAEKGAQLRDDLRDYLTLEADSRLVRAYETRLVPGLLRTGEYTAAVFRGHCPEDEALRMTDTGLRRREAFLAGDCRLEAVLDVTVLHSVVGTERTMADQLDHLLAMAEHPRVEVRVLPLRRTVTPGQYPPCTIFTMRGEPSADYVWLEHLTSGTLLDREHDLERYRRAWAEHTAAAASPEESREHIRQLAHDYRAAAAAA
ncbi:helix-turn-helix domain-containing protein [Streptomyces sp. NPDC059506]|uniref:Helix-turn-helix transcriptional regulator n=1 Tax=Streptomyces thermolineatus TaxID=44033 RepID=A0ABN3L4Y5_9ACTN|nr:MULTISPECIES: helix-turn-helix transcriptional regulator [unclassified Streptomyces]MCZ2524731.1 helix-turn-helix transcriptional regulator [Streptomyces sp. HB2AG]